MTFTIGQTVTDGHDTFEIVEIDMRRFDDDDPRQDRLTLIGPTESCGTAPCIYADDAMLVDPGAGTILT